MPVGGSWLGSSLMTQAGTCAVPVAGPSGCVPPAPRGQSTRPVPPAPREQGGSATRGVEFIRPVERTPLQDGSNTGFQVLRRQRDGAPGSRPALADRETGFPGLWCFTIWLGCTQVTISHVRTWGLGRVVSMGREWSAWDAAAAPRKPDRSADSVGSTGSGSADGRGGTFKKKCYNCHQKGHRFSWGSAIPQCQGSTCSGAAVMLREGEGCCSPRKGCRAGVGGVRALSGFRPVRRGVGPHPGFVAGNVGIGGAGAFNGSRAIWRLAEHHPGFAACGGLVLQFPRLGPRHLWGGGAFRLFWCRLSPPRVNQALGRVLRPRFPVTTGSG